MIDATKALVDRMNHAKEYCPIEDAETRQASEPKRRRAGIIVSDVETEPIEWMWKPRAALGKLTVCDGDPGLGKSTLWYDIAARITTGAPMPDDPAGAPPRAPRGVVIINGEDGVADTIKPRLEAAGADTRRVSVLAMVPSDDDGPDRVLTIPDDLAFIEEEVRAVDAELVIIDPLMAHLGSNTNSFRDQDVRRALAPVADFAQRARVCVVTVRHLNKMSGGSALYRGGGSIGIIGAARVGLLVGRDPEDDERIILACTKNNIARMPEALSFRVVSSPHNPDVSMIRWEGPVSMSAHELLAGPSGVTKQEAATEWLERRLAAGPLPSTEIMDEARAAGFSEATIKRARKDAEIKVRPVGSPAHGGYWEWSLETFKALNTEELTPLITNEHKNGQSASESPPF
jgi:hypothetical protein